MGFDDRDETDQEFEVRRGELQAPVASGLTRLNVVVSLNQARSFSLPPPCLPITVPSYN